MSYPYDPCDSCGKTTCDNFKDGNCLEKNCYDDHLRELSMDRDIEGGAS